MPIAPDKSKLDTDSYVASDPYFGKPYIDRDEHRDAPYPHRNIHGGFANTDTRFTFYFPAKEEWGGRMYHPLEGAHAGHEEAFAGVMGAMLGGLDMMVKLGGYMCESNSGHIGDDVDPRAGNDPGLYGYRASIESARFSKHIAKQFYGREPDYSYVWGGSGGGRRSPGCLEYGAGVYDGALPFMGGGNIEPHGTNSRVRSEQPLAFAAMFNVQRLLQGEKLAGVIDATQPGGSGDPYAGLTAHERGELAALYRLGYPRGDEYMIAKPMGQMWLWCSIADMFLEEDANYFAAFWTQPGYVGHDEPDAVRGDLIDTELPVTRVITAQDLTGEEFAGPEFADAKPMALLMASASGQWDLPVAIEIKGVGTGYRTGAGVRIASGDAAGRSLYCSKSVGDVFFCDGRGDANILRFAGVKVGDKVHVDNRAFLAFCYSYRHHISDDPLNDFLRVDGKPIYPQHGLPLQSPLMGVPYSGQYEGKLLWIHHTHDASLWPPQGVIYQRAVAQAQGAKRARERFRLQWTENAEHIPPMMLPSNPQRASTTWLINYMPSIEQGLVDLAAWVEKGVPPAETKFVFADGKVTLPPSAKERGGTQPVVSLTANGMSRCEVRAGETVTIEAKAEAPAGAGAFTHAHWDFDGSGAFAATEAVKPGQTSLTLSTQRAYDKPGTYFATIRVRLNREGDPKGRRQIENLASARIIVA